jgi:pimeloyl-ACP methyl ester carboxylesterase
MREALPSVLVPGLLCTPRLYADQIAALWAFGPVTVADHTRDDTVAVIARNILAAAPPRFALVGLSMGGYISFEIMRQAPQRVAKLALLDTSARPETPEQTAGRREQIALARAGRFGEVADRQYANLVAPQHQGDEDLRRVVRVMAEQIGAEAFERQQTAIMGRPDSRPSLAAIRCPMLMLVGDQDALTPPERAREIAAGVSGARLVTVPNCGHLSPLERPDEVSRALTELLQS